MSETTLDHVVNVCVAVGAVGFTAVLLVMMGVLLWALVKEGRRVFSE